MKLRSLTRFFPQSTAGRLAFGFFLALIVRLVMFTPFPPEPGAYLGGDGARFIAQGLDLEAGKGFLFKGQTCTFLPPGYPALLALTFLFWKSLYLAVPLQVLLSSAMAPVLYLILKRRSTALASIGMVALALHPWSAWRNWQVMSETAGAVLMMAMLWGVAQIEFGRRSWATTLLIGAAASAIILTCPGALFVAAFCAAATAFYCRKQPAALLGLVFGFCLFMGPWQYHCYRSVGRVVPTILTSGPSGDKNLELKINRGFQVWVRTWLTHPGDFLDIWMYFVWDTHPRPEDGIEVIPAEAFESPEQKRMLEEQVTLWRANETPIPERDRYFRELVGDEPTKNSLNFHVVKPLQRTLNQWAEMPFVWHMQKQYAGRIFPKTFTQDREEVGVKRAIFRWSKGLGSSVMMGVHWAYLIAILGLMFWALRRPNLFSLSIVAGTLLFTVFSAYSGMAELRRNIPFYPALFYLLIYYPIKSSAKTSSSDPTESAPPTADPAEASSV